MPLKTIRVYGKNLTEEKSKPIANQSTLSDISLNTTTEVLTEQQSDPYSPDVIGVDWNDTFDRLLQNRSKNINPKDETPRRKSAAKRSLMKSYESLSEQNDKMNSDYDGGVCGDVNVDLGSNYSFRCSSFIQNGSHEVQKRKHNDSYKNEIKFDHLVEPIAKSTPNKLTANHSLFTPILNSIESKHTLNNSPNIVEKEETSTNDLSLRSKNLNNMRIMDYPMCKRPYKPITNILPGKKWRRSLNEYIHKKSMNCTSTQDGLNILSVLEEQESYNSINFTNVEYKREHINDNITNISIVDKQLSYISISSDDTKYSNISNEVGSSIKPKSLSIVKKYDPSPSTAYEVVLRRCGQTGPLPFSECYPDIALRKCHKIGEGLFGEVYLYKDITTQECSVIKIIPIEGSLRVNGEKQKKFSEILSEIIIVMELSNLRWNKENATSGFCELKKISCVRGKYPEVLIDLWDLYDEQFGSENDNPQMFDEDQLYIVLELGNGGRSLEAFQFTNAKQSLSILRQISLSLAVAEKALQFEHRDLHWGNVLVVPTVEKAATYKLNGLTITLPLHGVKATVIDFTFSRITFNSQALYSDLGADEELFSADGDYQFDIYRHMRDKNCNDWSAFQAYSNILWMHYLSDKMIKGARYTHPKSKVHKINIVELGLIKESLLAYNSINEFLEDFNYFI